MNEAEIDALMAGQEDENGCVNYEGELPAFPVSCAFLSSLLSSSRLLSPSVLSSCCSLCQAHHVCVKDADHRTCADPMMSRHPLTVCCTTKGSRGTKKRTMRCQFLNPSILCFFFFLSKWGCFVFFSLSPAHLKAAPIVHLNIPCLIFFFFSSFFSHWLLQWNSGTVLLSSITWHKDDHPLLSEPFFSNLSVK